MVLDDTTLAESGFHWLEKDGVQVLVSIPLEEAGFSNGFSTRLGGVSPFPESDLNLAGFGEDSEENIAENRKRFLSAFNPEFRLTSVWQIHSDTIKKVSDESSVSSTEDKADAMISDLEGVLLGVKTADCVPVLIADPKTRSFASIHAGWRGTVSSIVDKSIRQMSEEYDADPADMICAIGPAATCKNYEIGPEVKEQFDSAFAYSDDLFIGTENGHALIDLHKANREQAQESGINPANITIAPFCTMERTDLFFSYRREKLTLGKTGRLMSVIGLGK